LLENSQLGLWFFVELAPESSKSQGCTIRTPNSGDVDSEFAPIDASGVFPDGTKIDGPADLRRALLRHSTRFITTVTDKLLTYALGRGVESYDAPAVRAIVADAAAADYRFSAIVLGIVRSAPFQMRRPQP